MDIWPGSHVQHVKPKQQTNKCQCQCQYTYKLFLLYLIKYSPLLNIFQMQLVERLQV
jgi:hypothetical protein